MVMFIGHIFNKENLFQYFGGWLQSEMEKTLINDIEFYPKGEELFTISPIIMEDILFRASNSWINLHYLDRAEKECISEFIQFKNKLNIRGKRLYFWSPTLSDLMSRIPPIMSSIRIMQNFTLKLLNNRFNISLPKSMSSLIKKGNDYNLPTNIYDLIVKYWIVSGRSVKDYRDFEQHYLTLIRNVHFRFSPKLHLFIPFPDNPEIKSFKRFTYHREINGIEYIKSAFNSFHNFIELLSVNLGFRRHNFSLELKLGYLNNYKNKNSLGTIGLNVYSKKKGNADKISFNNGRINIEKIL